MDQLKGIAEALIELVQKLAGDNESLSKLFDTVKAIFDKFTKTEETPAE